MRARGYWRRCAALALAACCLPLALRLLRLGGSYAGGPLLLPLLLARAPVDGTAEAATRRGVEAAGGGGGGESFAGAYMAGSSPGNVSHCRWQYGLPHRLEHEEQQLISSPESPTGRQRVLPFAVRGAADEGLPQVTLCSHASADQAYGVVELARRWEGPLALAIFAPGSDAGLAVAMIERACRCDPAMARVSVHLIFPREAPPSVSASSPAASPSASPNGDCSALDLQLARPGSTERRRSGIPYPINVARNVARALAPTQRVLVSDVELLPSEGLASRFLAMLRGRAPRRALAFVLPVFEVEAEVRPPSSKAELLAALRAGLAVYFHKFYCPHCQKFPGLSRWLLRPDPGRVKPLIITKREYPHQRWEPIFIGTKHDPLYTEDMSWEGRQDKMTQMLEMCLMNYRLIILDGAFLVHRPGIKRRGPDELPPSNRQRAYERQNAMIYQRVTRRLVKQYPANRRCRP